MSLIASAALPMLVSRFGVRSRVDLAYDVVPVLGQLGPERHRLHGGHAGDGEDHAEAEDGDDQRGGMRPASIAEALTAGASRKESRIATATGINTSWRGRAPRSAMSSAMTEPRRGRVPLEMYADTRSP